MSKNNKKTLLFSIISVLLIGLIVTGGTFAYFQWSLGYASGTSVNVTIEHGGVTMHIESEAKEFVGLYPTKVDDSTDCDRARYGDALVTIVNKTGTMAIPSFKLKVKVTKGGSDALTKGALEHIRYTVVPITTTVDASGNPVKGNEVSNCSVGVTGTSATGNKYDVETNWSTFGMKFESVSTASAWSHIPAENDYINGGDNKINSEYLPRQYNTNTGNVEGITFKAPQYAKTYQYFRVYVWIDEGYTTTTIGNIVSDPLQNAKIEVMWSENSMVEQVVGSGTAADYPNSIPLEEGFDPGQYDENNNYTSWDTLIENGDISVNGTILESGSYSLSGKLIIPEGITEIGDKSFCDFGIGMGSNLTSVTIPSTVTRIGDEAFCEHWSLNEVIISPDSQLEEIGELAFNTSTEINEFDFGGTKSKWNAITFGADWNSHIDKIKCTDGIIYLISGLYDTSDNYISWEQLLSTGDITVENNVITDSNIALTGELIIPEGITSIGTGSFTSTSLNSVTVPASVTNIESSAFEDSSLNTITFAENSQLREIWSYVFSGSNLTSIEIPPSLTLIDDYGLADITNLNNISFKGTVAQWNSVDKGLSWNEDTPATEVICSDGTVSLN